ncbi:MAG: VOC family protein [Cyanobacteriota bacterium]|nr:VOC family protein [Cyanobacteriota bacterium]
MNINQITINLIVIRVKDLETSKKFYETLGINFVYEQHGKGEKHLSAVLEEIVFEIYPSSNNVDTSQLRLGFRVSSVDKVIEKLQAIETDIISPPKDSQWGRRAVILDPDGYKIELITKFMTMKAHGFNRGMKLE